MAESFAGFQVASLNRIPRLALLVLQALFICGESSAESAGTKVFAQNSASIVRIEHGWPTRTTQGSGVVVADKLVVTNCHVVRGAHKVFIVTKSVLEEARLLHAIPQRDLCLVQVPNLTALSVAQLAMAVPPTGAQVFAIGAPFGLDLTLSEGIVSNVRDTAYGKVIQTTAAISPGSSGGGLFDNMGALVGITTAQVGQGQSLNFAVPVDELRRWVDAYQKAGRGAKMVVGDSVYPPHVQIEVSRHKRDRSRKMATTARMGGNGIRLTFNSIATTCSSAGVTTWPVRTADELDFWHGRYVSPTGIERIVYADTAHDICIWKVSADLGETPTVSVGKTSAARVGDVVFAFVDPNSSTLVDIGTIELTIPAESGYGNILSIRSSRMLRVGTGIFSVEGKLLGIVAGHSMEGLAKLASIERLLSALEHAN